MATADPAERSAMLHKVWDAGDQTLGGIAFTLDYFEHSLVIWGCDDCSEGTSVGFGTRFEWSNRDVDWMVAMVAGTCVLDDCNAETSTFEGVPMVTQRGFTRGDVMVVIATLIVDWEYISVSAQSSDATLANALFEDAFAMLAPVALAEF